MIERLDRPRKPGHDICQVLNTPVRGRTVPVRGGNQEDLAFMPGVREYKTSRGNKRGPAYAACLAPGSRLNSGSVRQSVGEANVPPKERVGRPEGNYPDDSRNGEEVWTLPMFRHCAGADGRGCRGRGEASDAQRCKDTGSRMSIELGAGVAGRGRADSIIADSCRESAVRTLLCVGKEGFRCLVMGDGAGRGTTDEHRWTQIFE